MGKRVQAHERNLQRYLHSLRSGRSYDVTDRISAVTRPLEAGRNWFVTKEQLLEELGIELNFGRGRGTRVFSFGPVFEVMKDTVLVVVWGRPEFYRLIWKCDSSFLYRVLTVPEYDEVNRLNREILNARLALFRDDR
jgi:hypothetical protein